MLKKIIVVATLLFSTLTHAQSTRGQAYTLDDCIAIALQKHQSLRVSDAQLAMAEALHDQAMSSYWPRVSIEANASRADQDRTFTAKGDFALPPTLGGATVPLDIKMKLFDRDVVAGSINATYPIFTGLKRPAMIGQAEKGVMIAEQGRRKSSLEVVRDVKKYFYGAQLALQMEQLASDTLERFKALEDLTERLYQNGSLKVRKTDYLRTKTTTALTRSILHEAEYSRQLAHEALGNAMGQSWDAEYRLVETEMPKALTAELKELVEAALQFNPDVQQLKLAVQASDHGITAAQSGYYPMIGIKASAHTLWNDYKDGLFNEDNKDGWNIGIGMEWELFSGFETKGKVDHAEAMKKKLESQTVLLDQGMALQVKQQFLRIRSSGKQIEDTEAAFGFARENRKLNSRAYQQEMVETKDVIEAQLVESFTQGAYYRSRYALEIGLASLEYLIGHNIEKIATQ